jgi:hypothetical protein
MHRTPEALPQGPLIFLAREGKIWASHCPEFPAPSFGQDPACGFLGRNKTLRGEKPNDGFISRASATRGKHAQSCKQERFDALGKSLDSAHAFKHSHPPINIFDASELSTPKWNLYRRRKTFCQTQESLDRVYQQLSPLSTLHSFASLFPGPPFRAFRALFLAGRPIPGCKRQHSRTTSRQTGKMLK